MLTTLRRLSIATRLWLLVGAFAVFGVADNLSEMALVDRRLHAEKETQLRHLVETAHALLQAHEGAAREGKLSEGEAKARAIDTLRALRYAGLEYFWLHDLGAPVPRMVMHPTVPALDGQVLADPRFARATAWRGGGDEDYRPLANDNLFVAMNRALSQNGDGFVAYDWPKPLPSGGVSERLYPKLSYVKRFAPWGWVVGSGLYIDDLQAEYWRDARVRLVKAALWVVLLGVLLWLVTRGVIAPMRAFQAAVKRLRGNPQEALAVPAAQPGELGQLAREFGELMNDLQRSRAELGASIDKLRQASRAFTGMREGLLVTGPDGRVLAVNPAFTRLTGHAAEDLIGRRTDLLRADRHNDAFFAALWQALERQGHWSGVIHNRCRDGVVRAQHVRLFAVRDEQDVVRCYLGVYWAAPEKD